MDSLRDKIGQAIYGELHCDSIAEDVDWFDSREVDRLADAALAVALAEVAEMFSNQHTWITNISAANLVRAMK